MISAAFPTRDSRYRDEFFQNISFRVGNGAYVKFWKDKWLGSIVLKDLYPALDSIAYNPELTIADNREGNIWSITLRRNLQDWACEDFLNLLALLEGHSTTESQPDRTSWGSSSKGICTVKAGHKHLCPQNGMIKNWPWKLIWRTKLPTKVSVLHGPALYGAGLNLDNLSRWKIQLVNRCYMCQRNMKSNVHLLIHCPVAAELRNFFFSLFRLSWVQPQSIKDAYESWSYCGVDKAIKKIWMMIPATNFWCLWNERNRRCFDGISTPPHTSKANCLMNLYSWSSLYSPINFLDFVSSLNLA
ncbi:uncharacterized protein LOC132039260 [Lycium ferocissimum]|uniref:uncharacterized protein LOC132039260 n=1 Tax=Lycium ferocissimum TaxID=112874 RepID=UPI002814C577|nr:uncharacterized protein LOC132039260 [Lycium ferocissimum]